MKSTALIVFSIFVLAGCSISPKTLNTGTETDAIDRVAQNLVYTLVQVPGLHPAKTKIQLDHAEDPFGIVLQNRLWDAGYGIHRLSSDNDLVSVTYTIQPVDPSQPNTLQYVVSIGDIGVSREYRRDAGGLYPSSKMALRGVPVNTRVRLNDEIFGRTPSGTIANPTAMAVVVEPPPVLAERSIRTRLEPHASSLVTESGEAISKDETAPKPISEQLPLFKSNMYETRESNYAALFTSYDELSRSILVFPNDSLVMGNFNKQVVAEYADVFNSDTDLFSVIGCSHGKSALLNGNSVLAIGRANRVKEELIAHGVEAGRVMDEGCWAPVPFDEMMPRRGVVLKHLRSKLVSVNSNTES